MYLIHKSNKHLDIRILFKAKYIFFQRVCDEFIQIKNRALKKPETTEELNEMIKYIDDAKTHGIIKLDNKIKELKKAMAYLLDVNLFGQEDVDLNTRVILWPHEIGPVFDQNEEVYN
jgi:dynein heavy chain